jgi:hypothetical protein
MASFNTSKVDGNTVSASEYNQLAEVNNFITNTGQTPSTANLQQMGIGASRYSSAGQYFEDTGIANAYVLNPTSPFKSPVSSTSGEGYFTGMQITFKTANANTGASTVNINGAGVKNLKKSDGTTDLSTGEIPANQYVSFIYNGTSFVKQAQATATSTAQGINYLSLPANPITVGNNSSTPNTDIDFFAGVMNFHDDSGQALSTAMTKRLQSTGSWSAGNNGNMLLSGARANSSTYHLFAIYKTDGTIDYGALLGVAGTTPDPTSVLPTGYTKYEYIASLLTDASGNIRRGSYSFRLDGSYDFEFNTPVESRTFSAAPTTATLQTVAVPLGLKFNCELACRGEAGGTVVYSLIIDPQKTTTASSTNFNGYAYNNNGSVGYNFYSKPLTNTSAQVSLMSTLTNNLQILTKGYTYNPINR